MKKTLILGPPGTGKTTKLISIFEEKLKEGYEPEQIAFVSFTKAAAEEAKERVGKAFNLHPKRLPWFKTLHSIGFQLMDLDSSQTMDNKAWKEFGDQMRYQFSPQKASAEDWFDLIRNDGGPHDQLRKVYQLSKAWRCSIADAFYRMTDLAKVNVYDCETFYERLQKFKKDAGNDYYDFSDFIECRGEALIDVEIAIIDEAQDLTPQQWAFCEELFHFCREWWIAGDDDQAIYAWAGADVRRFLDLKVDEEIVLPKSYRLPRKVHDVCMNTVRKIGHRKEKIFEPRTEAGEVQRYSQYNMDQIHLSGENWLMISRHQTTMKAFKDMCRTQGRLYKVKGHKVNDARSFRAADAYIRLCNGEAITGADLKNVARFVPELKVEVREDDEVRYENVPWPWGENRPKWNKVLKIKAADLEYMGRVLKRGASLIEEPKIEINTIHSTKGKEADNVLVCTAHNLKVQENLRHDPDDELRVWYVAASRAKQRLFIAGPDNIY